MRAFSMLLWQIVILHTLDGQPVRIDANRLDVLKPSSQCGKGAGAAIAVGGNKLCVQETPERVCTIIRKFKKCEDQ